MTHRLVQPLAATALACLALSGCVAPPTYVPPPPAPTPAPAPAPAPAPTPAPAPAPPPFSGAWMDAPQTPGDWRYTAGTATFGQPGLAPALVMRCDRASGTVAIVRPVSSTGAQTIAIRTESGDRSVAATTSGAGIQAAVPVNDPILDAMAFSKGRFAIEIAGAPTVYAPAWPEVIRVIEDCR